MVFSCGLDEGSDQAAEGDAEGGGEKVVDGADVGGHGLLWLVGGLESPIESGRSPVLCNQCRVSRDPGIWRLRNPGVQLLSCLALKEREEGAGAAATALRVAGRELAVLQRDVLAAKGSAHAAGLARRAAVLGVAEMFFAVHAVLLVACCDGLDFVPVWTLMSTGFDNPDQNAGT
jgi:hypothetical protein